MLIARSISLAKWPAEITATGSIPADAITSDLRTRNNALSFWRLPQETEVEMHDTLVALASARDNIEGRIAIVKISQGQCESAGLTFHATLGETPLADAAQRHVDAVALDLDSLSTLAGLMAQAIFAGQVTPYSAAQTRVLLTARVQSGRIALDTLRPKVQEVVRRILATQGTGSDL